MHIPIQFYLTTQAQSRWIEEKKLPIDNCFWWAKRKEKNAEGSDQWDCLATDPNKMDDWMDYEEVCKAFMAEQLKTFLPFYFLSDRRPTKPDAKGNIMAMNLVFANQSNPQFKDLKQVVQHFREVDAVFTMIEFLIKEKYMQPDQPGRFIANPFKIIV